MVVASSRLARGDASVTIGINMHLAAVANMARRYEVAVASGNEKRTAAFGRALRTVVDGRVVLAAAVSEPAQDLTRPATRAERTEDGWLINGKKIFCTMSPAANALYVAVTYTNDDGEEMYGYAQMPKATPGVTVNDDWDALGMRASGSHSVSFESVRLPASALRGGFPAGRLTAEFMERNLTAGAFHASSSLGIAEAAQDIVVKALTGKLSGSGQVGAHTQMLASQNAIDLSVMRSMLSRAGELIDEYYAAHATDDGDLEEIAAVFAEVQSAKTFINETAQRAVDRALSLSGGAGYFSRHPLSRAYRDVRAGAFMHPLGANRAYEFIGRIALGMEPALS
jgi:alkylation response protein AidB-like acyl-CoA dehydrogenase